MQRGSTDRDIFDIDFAKGEMKDMGVLLKMNKLRTELKKLDKKIMLSAGN
jgi:hypothetical protein